jgi:hypothetical protein
MIRKSQRARRKPEAFVPGNGALAPVNEEHSDVSNEMWFNVMKMNGVIMFLLCVCSFGLGNAKASSDAEDAEDAEDGYEEDEGEEESKRVKGCRERVLEVVCLIDRSVRLFFLSFFL